jgi:prolyl-tRNA synthetase
MRRDQLRDGDKVKSIALPRAEFLEEKAVQLLVEIQAGLYAEAKARLDGNIKSGVTDWAGVEAYYAGSDEEFKGWLKVSWSKPSGAELDAVDTKLKALKLTIRNAPLQQPDSFAPCLFTGQPGVEEILIGRAY